MTAIHSDFLVIGTGIAGLTAAKDLAKHGSVHVLSKGPVKESNTLYAQGGIAVAMQANDAPSQHFDDTLKAGAGLCDESMVKILVEEGPSAVQELIAMGANFDKDGSELAYTKEAAHSQRRILHAGDATGREIEKTLGRAAAQDPKIQFFAHTTVLELLMEAGRCVGCIAKDKTGHQLFTATAILLATGGACQLFQHNTNPPGATGEGMSLAYDVGARLQDLEFIQFHPTTLYLGDKKPISLFLISEAVRGEGAILRNAAGERFMPRYHELEELAPRDVVSRAIFKEIKDSHQNNVYLDLSELKVSIPERFPTIYKRCLESNIDISKDLIPVAPAAHYFIGGVKTNDWAETTVPGLFAAGEVAATGIHGANRLASNSLLEGLVFGKRAAEKMAMSRANPETKLRHIDLHNREMTPHPRPTALALARHSIRELMWRYVGIEREGKELKKALLALNDYAPYLSYKGLDEDQVILRGFCRLAGLITSAALEREESRGAHYRSDFPDRNKEELRNDKRLEGSRVKTASV